MKLPFLAGWFVLAIAGCTPDVTTSTDKDRGPKWVEQSLESTVGCEVGLTVDRFDALRVTVRNRAESPIAVSSYHFGYALKVRYNEGEVREVDFGADKVPVETPADWHVLKPDMSISWTVILPKTFKPLDSAVEVSYRRVHTAEVTPPHILKDIPEAKPIFLDVTWKPVRD